MLELVKAALIEYLALRLSAAELAGRLPDGWELDQVGDIETRRLVLKVMGLLAERQREDRTDEELRSAIGELLRSPARPILTLQGAVERVTRPQFRASWSSENKSPLAALA